MGAALGRNHAVYEAGKGSRRVVLGGPLNALPFDAEGGYQRQRIVHVEAESGAQAGWLRHVRAGMSYEVSLARGRVRVYPIRGHRGKYIEFGDITHPDAFSITQLSELSVDYWIQYAGWRLIIRLSDLGAKALIEVDETYTGAGTFDLVFRLVGLTMIGRTIYDGAEPVLKMPTAVLWDSAEFPTLREVGEVYQADKVTITADLTGLTFPVTIDPSLTVQPENSDTFMQQQIPNTPDAAYEWLRYVFYSGYYWPNLYRFDFSSVEMFSISAATMGAYFSRVPVGAPYGKDVHLDRCTKPWTLAATYNKYDGVNSWAKPGGDRDETYRATTQVPGAGSVGSWMLWNVTALAIDALELRGSVLSLESFNAVEASNIQAEIHSSRYTVNPLLRPYVSIDYIPPSNVIIPSGRRIFAFDTARRGLVKDISVRELGLDTERRRLGNAT